ncbi:translation initiation factor IF-3 [Arthrobacter sp. H14-L1]|uniref:translation initiation factor IF-3 n=1 Tax=Arthrobacter sp. H14-L1 TaxID=2996697 RepID=UPI003B63897B
MRLVGPAGEQVGIVRIEDALRLAAESDLDLVEVAPTAKPPVCKLMDFGKYKYEAAVKAREARKNQTNTVLKEIRFRLKIDKHDYETKTGHALRFLGAGDKVKAMIQFRGREQQRPEMGIRLLQRFAADVGEVGAIESSPRIDGRNMVMVIGPLKNKAEAKAEARRAAQRADSKAHNEAVASGHERVDVDRDSQAPMTQSLADLLPEGLRLNENLPAVPAAAAAVETPAAKKTVSDSAATNAPAAAAAGSTADKRPMSAPAATGTTSTARQSSPTRPASSARPATSTRPTAATAPSVARPAMAVKAPAARPAATGAAAAARPVTKPAEAAKPVTAKPVPAPKPVPMPKPVAKPAPVKPAPVKPAATKPAPKAAPRATAESTPAAAGASKESTDSAG